MENPSTRKGEVPGAPQKAPPRANVRGASGSRTSRPQTGRSLILATLQTSEVRARPGQPRPPHHHHPEQAGDFSFCTKPPGAEQREEPESRAGVRQGKRVASLPRKVPADPG